MIHSPLVGPSTVAPLAAALEALGWTTTVPDLRTAIQSPTEFAQRAVGAADSADVVLGHSGAGAFLPGVADAMNAAVIVFVDAVVPQLGSLFVTSAGLLQFLDTLPVVDGLLPPWHEWWPAARMAELVPDQTLRRRIMAEIPRMPRSFYDEAVPGRHLDLCVRPRAHRRTRQRPCSSTQPLCSLNRSSVNSPRSRVGRLTRTVVQAVDPSLQNAEARRTRTGRLAIIGR